MNEIHCDWVMDRLPVHVAGQLPSADADIVERHLRTCAECHAQMELLLLLRRSRPSAPAELADRIRASVRFRRSGSRRAGWGLGAAAVAVLAIGIGISAARSGKVHEAVPAYAADLGTSDIWLSDDGVVAGAPVLEGLSTQALEQLLKEMGQWKTGA